MSKNDILGSLVRVLVTVPEDRLGIVKDFSLKLAGAEGGEWEEQGKLFLRKELPETPPAEEEKLEPEVLLDHIVKVDRSTKLVFPDWTKKIMHPEIQDVGPSEFDITQVERWLHDDQKTGWVNGTKIYEFHKDNDMLKDDFGLRELLAIQAKGIKFFRTHLKGKVLYGWKSVVLNDNGNLRVPYFVESGGEVILDWDWLDSNFFSYGPALRLASSSQDSVAKIS